jgi:phytoene synthase
MSSTSSQPISPQRSRSTSSRAALKPMDAAVQQSFEYCAQLAKERAGNFYYGMMLTPRAKRGPMYAIYAWMREADDLADEAGESDAKAKLLERFRKQTHAAMSPQLQPDASLFADASPMWPAVRYTLRSFEVPADCLESMIEGQLLDQVKTRYETFDELRDYCYMVASTVGLVCVSIWGYTGGDATRELAIKRGIALQLTNIIRDLVEDAQRDRVYIPADELDEAGYDAESFKRQLIEGRADEKFDRFLAKQIDRARSYYEQSAALETRIDPSCVSTCWALMRIYRALLDKIAADPRRVLRERVKLTKLQKVGIAAKAMWRQKTNR